MRRREILDAPPPLNPPKQSIHFVQDMVWRETRIKRSADEFGVKDYFCFQKPRDRATGFGGRGDFVEVGFADAGDFGFHGQLGFGNCRDAIGEIKRDGARDWARERAQKILREHQPDPLEPKLIAELNRVIALEEKH